MNILGTAYSHEWIHILISLIYCLWKWIFSKRKWKYCIRKIAIAVPSPVPLEENDTISDTPNEWDASLCGILGRGGPRSLFHFPTYFLGRFLSVFRIWNLIKCFSTNVFTFSITQLKCLLQKCSFLVIMIAIVGPSGNFGRKSESIKEVRNGLNGQKAKLNT